MQPTMYVCLCVVACRLLWYVACTCATCNVVLMYMFIQYVCMLLYMYVHLFVYVSMCVCICVCAHLHMRLFVQCICMKFACVYVSVCVCACVCACVCIRHHYHISHTLRTAAVWVLLIACRVALVTSTCTCFAAQCLFICNSVSNEKLGRINGMAVFISDIFRLVFF